MHNSEYIIYWVHTLRKPCCSPSYTTSATGRPFSFTAWYIFRAWPGGTTWETIDFPCSIIFSKDHYHDCGFSPFGLKYSNPSNIIVTGYFLTLSSNPWNKIMGQENLSTEFIGDLSKQSFSLLATSFPLYQKSC